MTHKGGCHCGRIAYEVEGEPGDVFSCNCSLCSRKGALMWFVPREQLRMLTPEENMATYTFNKQVIKHHFCPTCGIHPLGEGADRDGNAMAAINVRCLEGIDPDALHVKQVDGRSL